MLRTAAFKTIVVVFAMIVCATVLSSAAFAYAPTAVVYTVGNDGDTGGLACDTPVASRQLMLGIRHSPWLGHLT